MLSDFYDSAKWLKLIKLLRIERTGSDGFLRCEHCGQPIVKKYDCIAHHVIYLTEQNYQDAEISLNPDNIQLLHHKCHNIVHDKLGFYSRKIFLVHGSPLSGKTTFVKQNKYKGDLVIDLDLIWMCLTGGELYDKPDRLKSLVFDVRDLLTDRVRTRCGNWRNAYVIGGYPLVSERERLLKRLGAEDIYIDTEREECERRLAACDDGRDKELWKKYIADYWDKLSLGVRYDS